MQKQFWTNDPYNMFVWGAGWILKSIDLTTFLSNSFQNTNVYFFQTYRVRYINQNSSNPSWKISNWEGILFWKKDRTRVDQLYFNFKFEDENVIWQACTTLPKAWLRFDCRILVGENFYFFGEITQGRNGYTFGYRFVVDNQKWWVLDIVTASKTWICLFEF